MDGGGGEEGGQKAKQEVRCGAVQCSAMVVAAKSVS